MNPATHVLIVSADPAWRQQLSEGLNQAAAKRGAHNDVSRLARLAKFRAAHMLPADLVRNVADAIHSDGLTCKQAAEKFGVREDMAKIIRRGQHAHQRAPVLRGASVFSFGG